MATSVRLDLDSIDAEAPDTTFTVRVSGRVLTLVSARDLAWDEIIAASQDRGMFVQIVVPQASRELLWSQAGWKLAVLAARWRRHHGLCADVDGDQRLAMLVRRYGAAIEQDLAPGLDLVEMWRSRRWRRLLNLIDGLPRDSAYSEAMADDDDLARALARKSSPEAVQAERRMREFSTEVELLSTLVDRVGELIAVSVATRGARPPRISPQPRPKTAFDRARAVRRGTTRRTLNRRLLPHQEPDT